MANNKVEYFGDVLIDLTADTVTKDVLLAGYTAHGADGSQIVGEMESGGGGDESPNLVQYGIFDAGSGATSINIVFDTPLVETPYMILFVEETDDYSSTARTKGCIGTSKRLLSNGSTTTYGQRRWYCSSSNYVSVGNSGFITSTTSGCIRGANKNGFTAYQYNSSYKLYGQYRWVAVATP